MPNKTVYATKEDEPFWDEATRLLPFYQGISLSQFINDKIREYVQQENARQDAKKSSRLKGNRR